MVVRLSYFVSPVPVIRAQERGLLDGVELVESRTSGSPEQLQGLLAGDLDLVVTAIDNCVEWTRAGARIVLVGQVEATTPLGIFARSETEDLAALAGCRFAVDAFDNGFALVARYLLVGNGVEPDWHELGGVRERFDALMSGRTDATLLGPPFDDAALEAGCVQLLRVQDALPDFPGQGLVVHADRMRASEVATVLRALRMCGLRPVDPQGLNLLTCIRRRLGLLNERDGFPHILSEI